MKKICIITTVSLTLKTFVMHTAEYLHRSGEWDITFVCAPDEAFAQSLPDYIHFIPVPMQRGINLSGFGSIRKFKKLFREQQFDLVQYATPNASLYAAIAAKKARVPIRLYGQWGIRYYSFAGLSRSLFRTIEKYVCAKSTAVWAISPENRQVGIADGLYPPEKAHLIGYGGAEGVDLDEYDITKRDILQAQTRQEYGILPTDTVFGFAGRLHRDKGCRELVEAFLRLRQAYSGTKLLLVGPKESGELDEMLFEKIEQCPDIIMTGMKPMTEMYRYFAAMDVLVHAAYREGFGGTIREAGAMGCAVVTTDVPGAREVMEPDVSCLIAKARDVDTLYQAMERMHLEPEMRRQMAAAGRKRCEERFGLKEQLERELAFYQMLTGEKT